MSRPSKYLSGLDEQRRERLFSYLCLGITPHILAVVFGVPVYSLDHQIRKLRRQGENIKSFRNRLVALVYAHRASAGETPRDSLDWSYRMEIKRKVSEEILSHVNLKPFAGLENLVRSIPENPSPYQSLIIDIFGIGITGGMKSVVLGQLDSMLDGERDDIPGYFRSAGALNFELRKRIFTEIRNYASGLPSFSEVDKRLVGSVLHTLTPKEACVIKDYYGLEEHSRRSLKEIGNELGVGRQRIQQVKSRALGKLRHPARSRDLRHFISVKSYLEHFQGDLRDFSEVRDKLEGTQKALEGVPMIRALSDEVNALKLRLEQLEHELSHLRFRAGDASYPHPENLKRSVEELMLSVRAYNCFKNAGIKTVGELIQKTEVELLRIKNFGRKSLKEVKEILAEMGLSLGMSPQQLGLAPD